VPHVSSFGFRGEALSSISNISHVTISSQEPNTHEGHTITVEGGAITHEQITARAPGTDIIVDNIFYNVPARKKFLKKRETEWRGIYQLCVALALSRPGCGLRLTHDGRTVLRCPRADDYQERLAHIHDQYFAKQFIPCHHRDPHTGITIEGLVTHPEYHRYDRSMITCFVNTRWVKNHRLSQAVIKGYADMLPHRRFPAGYIFVSVPAEEVDINVHPRKEEVQFLHPRRVERAIEHAVRSSLETHMQSKLTPHRSEYTEHNAAQTTTSSAFASGSTKPHTTSSPFTRPWHTHKEPQFEAGHHVIAEQPQAVTPHRTGETPSHTSPRRECDTEENHTAPVSGDEATHAYDASETHKQEQIYTQPDEHDQHTDADYTIIGQVHNTYIIVEHDDGMTLIDQHAAHERVLYETFAHDTQIATTQLIFPHRIAMSQSDCDTIMEHVDHMARYGITIDRFDTTNVVITAVPIALKSIDWSDMLQNLVSIFSQSDESKSYQSAHPLFHDLCATMACKAAIKAGDQLSHAEMYEIIRKLYQCPYRMTCPHGRPTIMTFSHDDLQRKFKRIT